MENENIETESSRRELAKDPKRKVSRSNDPGWNPILEASHLFAEMVQHGLRCITFCRTRKLCELVLCHTREILRESAIHLADKVYSYRGGYVAE
ncbi:hypothetical protein OROGR_004669 [Orobanche gracilis]